MHHLCDLFFFCHVYFAQHYIWCCTKYQPSIDMFFCCLCLRKWTRIARFMRPTWGPSGANRTQVGPMLAPWTLLYGNLLSLCHCNHFHWSLIFVSCICLHVALINSLRPSEAYTHQWTNQHWFRQWLVTWFGPSHYLNQCWNIVSWTHRNKLQWNFNQNSYIFFQENAFEDIVWKKAAILSQPQCVNMPICRYSQDLLSLIDALYLFNLCVLNKC